MKFVVDFDDYSEGQSRLDLLYRLKAERPGFKVTLFAPPLKSSLRFLEETNKLEWVQLAIHGWEHQGPECLDWTPSMSKQYISTALGWNVFVKGFKAPHWAISQPVYDACRAMNVWVADNVDRASSNIPIPVGQPIYLTDGEEIMPRVSKHGYSRIHGHISWVKGIDNDIALIYQHILELTDESSEFSFIDDIIKEHYK
jgi:hypothetical protein